MFKREITRVIKTSRKQLLWTSFLIWFLLFLLNIFLAWSLYASKFSDTIKEKLGLYFYIKNTEENKDLTYKQVIQLKDELEGNWLEVMFSSQEDAFKFLEKKFPDIIDNFKKFWINNPLPSTLYVMFKDEWEYNILRNTIIKYKDIILNIKDIDEGSTIKQQENRVLTLINFSNFIQWSLYVVILIISIIIFTFLVFLLNSIFKSFSKELAIKKILWATYKQLTWSFIWTVVAVIWSGYIISCIMMLIGTVILSFYTAWLLNTNIRTYIWQNFISLFIIFVGEIIIIMSVAIGVAYKFLKTVNQRL